MWTAGQEDVHDHPPGGVPGGGGACVSGGVQEAVWPGARGDLPGGGAGAGPGGQLQAQHEAGVRAEAAPAVRDNGEMNIERET